MAESRGLVCFGVDTGILGRQRQEQKEHETMD